MAVARGPAVLRFPWRVEGFLQMWEPWGPLPKALAVVRQQDPVLLRALCAAATGVHLVPAGLPEGGTSSLKCHGCFLDVWHVCPCGEVQVGAGLSPFLPLTFQGAAVGVLGCSLHCAGRSFHTSSVVLSVVNLRC